MPRKTLNWKLANMRKPQEFVVVPVSGQGDRVTLQSDKSIGQFLLETGEGLLNTKGCYFVHLQPILGAQRYTLSPEQLKEVKELITGSSTVENISGANIAYADHSANKTFIQGLS